MPPVYQVRRKLASSLRALLKKSTRCYRLLRMLTGDKGTMELKEQEGIVLKSLDYQDNKRIITLITEEGLLQLIATVSPKNPHNLSLTTPLCHAHFHYYVSSSQLHRLQEGKILSSHLNYDLSYAHLATAMSFLQVLLSSQLPGKPAPRLYRLLKLYLNHLTSFSEPKVLLGSFMLKLMRHEGLLSLESTCMNCQLAPSRCLAEGICYCMNCKPSHGKVFDEITWMQLQLLALAKEMQSLKLISYDQVLHEQILNLFNDLTH